MEAGSLHLEETLRDIRKLPPDSLDARFTTTIPEERIPTTYIQQRVNAADRATVQRACLLAWAVTGRTQVPRESQLRVLLAIYHGIDCLFYAGTGSGKTAYCTTSAIRRSGKWLCLFDNLTVEAIAGYSS